MRWLRRGAAAVALAGLLLPAAAGAEELLVMPYACTVVGGQPVLTPGPEQGHRILGKRDKRKHRACSPVNPDMCRQWTVHRFNLDCDGQRVSWVSVVAATNEGSRGAWLLDGRLLLRMGPSWSLAPDDPCAQERGAQGSEERPIYGGRWQRECAQRLAMAPPPVVEMPFGYAPTLGVDAIFVTAKTPSPGAKPAPLQPPAVASAPPPKAAGDGKPMPSPPPRAEPKAGEPEAKEPLPAPQPAPKVASAPKAMPTPPPVADPPSAKTGAEPKPPVPKLATPPGPAKEAAPPAGRGPRRVIIPPSAQESEPKTGAAPEAKADEASPSGPAKVAVAAPTKDEEGRASAVEAAPQPTPPAEPERDFGLPTLLRPTTAGALVAFAGLALGLIAAFALARRREHARDIGRRRRNIAAVSLDGRPARAPGKPARDLRGRLEGASPAPMAAKPAAGMRRAAAPQPAPGPGKRPAAAPNAKPPPAAAMQPLEPGLAMSGTAAHWNDRMPRTREEALEVLGIGIAPSATAPAIKKIVDGLRMSWHPDLAQNETDRALREQRSKQINAAWDILQSEQAEV